LIATEQLEADEHRRCGRVRSLSGRVDEVAIQYLEDFIDDRENLRQYLSYDFVARHCISDRLVKLLL